MKVRRVLLKNDWLTQDSTKTSSDNETPFSSGGGPDLPPPRFKFIARRVARVAASSSSFFAAISCGRNQAAENLHPTTPNQDDATTVWEQAFSDGNLSITVPAALATHFKCGNPI